VKTCSRCRIEQPLSNFLNAPKDGGYKDGKLAECSPCRRGRGRTEFKEKYATTYGRARHLLNSIRSRAKEKGLPFDLDVEWLFERIKAGVCEVTGLPFSLTSRSFCPSVDQRQPGAGYTKANSQVTCWIYNRAKGVDGHDAVVRLAQALCE
jgi:hypothetical protein